MHILFHEPSNKETLRKFNLSLFLQSLKFDNLKKKSQYINRRILYLYLLEYFGNRLKGLDYRVKIATRNIKGHQVQ